MGAEKAGEQRGADGWDEGMVEDHMAGAQKNVRTKEDGTNTEHVQRRERERGKHMARTKNSDKLMGPKPRR